MEYYDLTNTGPEVQERLDLVPVTKADLDQEVLDRIEGDQRVLAESRAYCDLETTRAMQVEANLQAQIDAIIGSRLTITITKDVSKIYVGQATTISFVIGTSMDVSSCKLMRGSVEVASSDVPSSNYQFTDTLTVASDIGRVVYSVVAVLNGIERIQTVEIPVEKQTPTFVWNPSGDVAVTEGQTSPSDFPTLVGIPSGLPVVYSSSNPAVATVNSSGVVTVKGVGQTTIKAESQATDVYKAKSVSYKLTVLGAADYYIGWSKGTSFDDFAAMTSAQLVELATPYNKTLHPSITKTVTAADISGVTREVLFLMWKDGSAPNDGVFSSGGFVEQLSAQDFTNPNIFNASHANVTIEGETFHVSGMRLGFNVGDSLTVNF